MRNALKVLAFLATLLPGAAFGQCNSSTPLPTNTVLGRLGITPGPCQAIPFSVLSSQLTSAVITLNSGNGQTAPGAMSGGNTYSFGNNADKVQMTGLGLGGAAPLTGLEIYNSAVSPTGNGQGVFGGSSTNGGVLGGQGSTYDAVIQNKNGAIALGVTTGTQNLVLQGTLTAASLSTSGTIAGSLCMTSAGVMLYEAAINCFAVSGISVTSGKTLTITNTLTFSGTDGTVFTFPGTSDTIDTLAANQTISGNKTFSGTLNITGTGQINGTAFGTFATANSATPPAIGGTTPNTGAFSTLSATTPMGLTSGGTNASTAAGARASGGLNIDELTAHGDSNYQILATDRVVGTSTTLTAARTWTLPAASSVNAGQHLYIQDLKGFVSNTNTITIPRSGSDTINGGTGSQVINNANGGFLLISDGVSNWSAQALGAQATAGVASINGQTGNPSIVAGTGIGVSTTGGNISVSNVGVTSLNGQTGALAAVVLPQGRPTLTSGTPVMKANVTAVSQIFYDCYAGNQVPVFNGTTDVLLTIPSCEISDTMPTTSTGVTNANGVFDFWLINVSGALTMCHATNGSGGGWASDTGGTNQLPGTGYSQRDYTTRPQTTNKNSITHCYHNSTDLGPVSANQATGATSVYTTAAGQTGMNFNPGATAGGNNSVLGVYSFYNQVRYCVSSFDNTSSWTPTAASWQALNIGGTGSGLNNRVSWVDGVGQSLVNAENTVLAQTSGSAPEVYVGLVFDASVGPATGQIGAMSGPSTGSANNTIISSDQMTGSGLHFAQALQNTSNITGVTYFGIVSSNQLQRIRACLSM